MRSSGDYQEGDIANMDQIGQSGLDKRQATVQLTVFADGVDRVRPTIIFKRKGLRITTKEKESCDKRVRVMF